jgi:hypothetical protein
LVHMCILYGLRYIIVVLGDTPKLSLNGRMIKTYILSLYNKK